MTRGNGSHLYNSQKVMRDISFSVSDHERDIIEAIARRAFTLQSKGHLEKSKRPEYEFQMDITAVHANGCPLKLEALLNADNFNFAHDVFGIERHLDRTTGKLLDCFLPRYADMKAIQEKEKVHD